MSVGFELGKISPPSLDYIITVFVILSALFFIKIKKKCCIVNIFGCRRKFVHLLLVLRLKRVDEGLLVTGNASGLNVDVLQIPTYHIIIGYNLRSCNNHVQV
jgi:hypothetical protein